MVTTNSSPSLEDWRELYRSAIEFKELAPWDWMSDTDLFGVQNPEDSDTGYCCVLGGCGEFFGLAVYLGTEGLNAYLDLQSGRIGIKNDPFEVLLSKKCLVMSFENKSQLSKEDLRVIKKLGLVFKGKHAWPQFRWYEPGYYPWYLNRDHVIFLSLCLNQAMDVARRVRKEPDLLVPQHDILYFVRVPTKQDNNIEWIDVWLKPVELQKIVRVTYEFDTAQLKDIETTASRTDMEWEMDAFFVSMCVREKDERPHYPLAFLCVDRASDFILNVHLTHHARYERDFIDYFVNIIKEHKILPKRILVKKQELGTYLEPLLEKFSIELNLVTKFAALDKARRSLSQELTKGEKYV